MLMLAYRMLCAPPTHSLWCQSAHGRYSTHAYDHGMDVHMARRRAPVHHAIGPLIDAIELLKALHLPALLQHARPCGHITARGS